MVATTHIRPPTSRTAPFERAPATPYDLTQSMADHLIEFHCMAGVSKGPAPLPKPIPAVQGMPDWLKQMPADAISDVAGGSDHVRVQVLTNTGALDRDKQIAVVERLTALIAEAAGDPTLARRTWVLLTEATPGGWGLWGHAHTNDELVQAARAEIASLQKG